MKKWNTQRRFITLVEIMIVMFLIAMITGVIAYNYTGSLEEGKAFKTRNGIEKIKTILALAAAEGDIDEVVRDWKDYVKRSPLVQNPEDLIKDGWGQVYEVSLDENGDGKELNVTSNKLDSYNRKSGKSSLFSKK